MNWTYLSKSKRPKDPRRIIVEKERYGSNWGQQKKACLERDNYQCVRCGHQGVKRGRFWDVSAHHLVKIKMFVRDGIFDWKAANDLSNLITLCETNGCHSTADGHKALQGFVALK